tara:strand:- start:4987 stop:8076 length:3090 start_codon:yes stop_codon:yes gene_type:complete
VNPYDQFDDEDVAAAPPVQGAQPAAPGQPMPAAPQGPNPYDNPVALDETKPLPAEDFDAEFYRRLSAGESVPQLYKFAEANGRQIVADEGFLANIAERDAALAENRKPNFGQITVAEEGTYNPDLLSGAATFATRALNVPLYGFGDEAFAAGKAGIQALGGADFGEAYEQNWREANAFNQVSREANPGAAATGDVVGAIGSIAIPGAVVDKGFRAINAARNAGQMTGVAANVAKGATGAVAGATTGAVTAAGEGDMGNRDENVGSLALFGGALGAGFPLVAAATGRLARPVRERLVDNWQRAFGDRANITPEEMAKMEADLARLEADGFEPTLLDVMPERAQDVVGNVGRAHSDARTPIADVARARTNQLPERVGARGREAFTGDVQVATPNRPAAPEIVGEGDVVGYSIADADGMTYKTFDTLDEAEAYVRQYPENTIVEKRRMDGTLLGNRSVEGQPGFTPEQMRNPDRLREDFESARDAQISAMMDPIRDNPIPLSQDVVEALSTKQGIRAITKAAETETNRARRESMMRLIGTIQSLGKVDPNLGAKAQQQIRNALMQGTGGFTVNMADKISRALFRAAKTEGADSGALRSFGRIVRDTAKADPDYANAMKKYASQSESANAVETGEGILRADADQFVDDVSRISEVNRSDTLLPEGERMADVEFSPEVMEEGIRRWQGGWSGTKFQQGGNAEKITRKLRNGERLSDEEAGVLEVVMRAVQQGRVDGEELWRGMGFKSPDAMGEALSRSMPHPSSWTTDGVVADGFKGRGVWGRQGYLARIEYSGPAHRTDPNDTKWGHEQEVILPPGKIVSPNRDKYVAEQMQKPFHPDGQAYSDMDARFVPDPVMPEVRRAGTDRQAAQVGAAEAVRKQAGKGPNEARGVAQQFFDSPEQRRRTAALIGQEATDRLSRVMQEEVDRVYRASRQSARATSRREADSMVGAENVANALYNPTSPIPWAREGLRFLHSIGIKKDDAVRIATAAVDPQQTGAIIQYLKKHGANQERAERYVEELRDSIIRYASIRED